MTTTAAVPSGGLPGLLADLCSGLGQVSELVDALVSGVTAVLNELPAHVIGPVLDDVARIHRIFDVTMTLLQHAIDHAGDADALRAVGAAWTSDVGGTVSGLSGFASDNTTRADNYWTGDAADAYRTTLIPQRIALNEVKIVSDELDTVLNELASAIVSFWGSITGAVLTLITGLITVTVAATNPLTAPVAAVIGAGLLTTVSSFVAAQMNDLVGIFNESARVSKTIDQRVFNNTAFPGGDWPPATAQDMSDGSITDGDDTDWHMK